mgnify:CR=1 FL=1
MTRGTLTARSFSQRSIKEFVELGGDETTTTAQREAFRNCRLISQSRRRLETVGRIPGIPRGMSRISARPKTYRDNFRASAFPWIWGCVQLAQTTRRVTTGNVSDLAIRARQSAKYESVWTSDATRPIIPLDRLNQPRILG